MRTRFLVVAVGVAGLVAQTGAVRAAGDTTPPTLTAPVKVSWLVGSQLEKGWLYACGGNLPKPGDLRVYVPITFKWKGSDASGSVHYDLVDFSGKYGEGEDFTDSTQTSYTATASGWDATNDEEECGDDGFSLAYWDLTARDPSGNATTARVYGGQLRITQDDGLTDSANLAVPAKIAYSGTWSTSACNCWSNGSDHNTKTKGASATISLKSWTDPVHPAIQVTHLGLVMHTGPDRGKFQVYVDGVLQGTVDTYAATSKPRVIVWQASLPDHSSKVRIVNLATKGRPRIDLDAILTN